MTPIRPISEKMTRPRGRERDMAPPLESDAIVQRGSPGSTRVDRHGDRNVPSLTTG
jgi:hypothetical protein